MIRQRKHLLLLFGLAIGMFGFAFALVPLYNVFCEITGINGKPAAQAALLEEIEGALGDRQLTVEFLAKSARGMPWEFRPTVKSMVVRPGELNNATFYVRNRADYPVTGQAVPSVSPGQAALYMKKMECFCFEQQQLAAGGDMEIGVAFVVGNDLPDTINELTLSYTMFKVEAAEQETLVSHEVTQ